MKYDNSRELMRIFESIVKNDPVDVKTGACPYCGTIVKESGIESIVNVINDRMQENGFQIRTQNEYGNDDGDVIAFVEDGKCYVQLIDPSQNEIDIAKGVLNNLMSDGTISDFNLLEYNSDYTWEIEVGDQLNEQSEINDKEDLEMEVSRLVDKGIPDDEIDSRVRGHQRRLNARVSRGELTLEAEVDRILNEEENEKEKEVVGYAKYYLQGAFEAKLNQIDDYTMTFTGDIDRSKLVEFKNFLTKSGVRIKSIGLNDAFSAGGIIFRFEPGKISLEKGNSTQTQPVSPVDRGLRRAEKQWDEIYNPPEEDVSVSYPGQEEEEYSDPLEAIRQAIKNLRANIEKIDPRDIELLKIKGKRELRDKYGKNEILCMQWISGLYKQLNIESGNGYSCVSTVNNLKEIIKDLDVHIGIENKSQETGNSRRQGVTKCLKIIPKKYDLEKRRQIFRDVLKATFNYFTTLFGLKTNGLVFLRDGEIRIFEENPNADRNRLSYKERHGITS